MKKGLRTNLFAGVFGILCILMTMFFGYLFTIEIPNMVTMAMIIVADLTLWMVYVLLYVALSIWDKMSETK